MCSPHPALTLLLTAVRINIGKCCMYVVYCSWLNTSPHVGDIFISNREVVPQSRIHLNMWLNTFVAGFCGAVLSYSPVSISLQAKLMQASSVVQSPQWFHTPCMCAHVETASRHFAFYTVNLPWEAHVTTTPWHSYIDIQVCWCSIYWVFLKDVV